MTASPPDRRGTEFHHDQILTQYDAGGPPCTEGTINPQTGNWCDLRLNSFMLTSRYLLNLNGPAKSLTRIFSGYLRVSALDQKDCVSLTGWNSRSGSRTRLAGCDGWTAANVSAEDFVQKNFGFGGEGAGAFDVEFLPGFVGLAEIHACLLDLLSVKRYDGA